MRGLLLPPLGSSDPQMVANFTETVCVSIWCTENHFWQIIWRLHSEYCELWNCDWLTDSLVLCRTAEYTSHMESCPCLCSPPLYLHSAFTALISFSDVLISLLFVASEDPSDTFIMQQRNQPTRLLLLPLTWMQQQPSFPSADCQESTSNTCPLHPRQWKINQQTNE